jgi:replicative superfamily II helicase
MVKDYTPFDVIKGIGSVTAQKLIDAHVTTVELLAVQDPLDLEARSKIAETTCADIIRKARTHLGFSMVPLEQGGLELKYFIDCPFVKNFCMKNCIF